MSFGKRLRERRIELGMNQSELARQLGVTPAAVSNYESGLNSVKEEVLLRLFKVLDIDPNYLYQDSLPGRVFTCSIEERALVTKYRSLSNTGRQVMNMMVNALDTYRQELESAAPPEDYRQIPLYSCPAAAGYASPIFGEDFEYIEVTGNVPQGADLAVRIQGDSMEPYIMDGSVVYLNRDPLAVGDVGIFCVDGEMFCKQYVRDRLGVVYLFSLNRKRADADICLPGDSGRSLVCMGRVILPSKPPIPIMN